MPTRADFYIGRGVNAEWLGSIAFDGYPDGLPDAVIMAPSEEEFRETISGFLFSRDDGTVPHMGWPWPWNSSEVTDYAYAWDKGFWYTVGFRPLCWWRYSDGKPPDEEDEVLMQSLEPAIFPDMSQVAIIARGRRSGLILVGGQGRY